LCVASREAEGRLRDRIQGGDLFGRQRHVQRAQAGLGTYADELDCVAAEIAGYVAQGEVPVEARKLFEQLRARWPRRFEPEAALAR
jgi:hypothetical protein